MDLNQDENMPRDKTLSHLKVNKAIKEEFLEKGYEGASIRSIGARAGMTSAGLYRHYKDKEAMFGAMVEPLIEEIREWTRKHIERKHVLLDQSATGSQSTTDSQGRMEDTLWDENFFDLIREVILPRRDEFRILMQCARGTKYENFISEYAEANHREFTDAIMLMKQKGYPVIEIDEEELHMLLSAYLTACFEAIVKDCDEAQLNKHLNTVQEFFMPGWMKIMGLK